MKILIVEDEKRIAEVVRAYLQSEGYSVVWTDTGIKALDAFSRLRPSLVVLDLLLPDMPGEDVCRQIRETSDIPIIMMTAKSAEEDRIKGLGIGADDYIVKPFSPRELVARVKAVLRRTNKDEDIVLSFNKGSLVIDGQAHEVRVSRDTRSLTPMEFKLLFCLARNHGKVMSRSQLIDATQGYEFEGYDRTIDAHIKNIRQKIEADPKKPIFIQTIYGIGYKFTGRPDAG